MRHARLMYFYLKDYKKESLVLIILFSLYTVADVISVGSFFPLIDEILNNGTKSQDPGKLIKFINNLVAYFPHSDKLVSTILMLCFFSTFSAILGFFSDFLSKFFQYKIYEEYQNKSFKTICNKNYDFFVRKKQGELVYIGTNASAAVGELFHYLPKTAVELLRVSAIIIFLASMSLYGTALILLFIGLAGICYLILSSKFLYPLAIKIRNEQEGMMAIFLGAIQGIKELKIFQSVSFFESKFQGNTSRARKYSTINQAYTILPKHLGNLGVIVLISVALLTFKLKWSEEFIKFLPSFAVYLISIQKMIPAIQSIGNNWMGLKNLAPRLELLKESLDSDNEIIDSKKVQDLIPLKLNEEIKEISLTDLSFEYEKDVTVLNSINMRFKKNSSNAIVGPSGSGKSTLINLLTGLYFPTDGAVKFGELNLDLNHRSKVLEEVSIVTQEPFLFHGSVKDNIRLSKPDSTDEEIKEAAKLAFADEFIEELPKKYDTILGDKGARISGGQKQRIAIARALLKKPKILFLDEATSALDNASEQKIKEAISQLNGKMTIVIIAHRLTTIKEVDNIVVLDKGNILENGKHEELMEKKGLYYHLYTSAQADSLNQDN